jgi:hypothetical protein
MMPAHLRLGVQSVGIVLRASTFALHGKPFGELDPEQRRAAVRSWDRAKIDPIRQYVRLIRSLVLFSAHEWTTGVAAG